jgi:tyrosyl-tRNA synthetase
MGAIHFLRKIGKHLTVNYMMSKDSVQRRLETGLSYTEFSYQLLQGYDFQWLYENKGVRLQMGGSDQWGNITAGTELIRRMGGEKEAFAVTTPLITKADGSKFGKSEGGNIWLDANQTSPYQFYQFFFNVGDAEAPVLIRRLTFLSQSEILDLETKHLQDPGQRILQKALAEAVTILVHGEGGLETARLTTAVLFGKQTLDVLEKLPEEQFLQVFAGVPQTKIPASQMENDWTEILGPGTEGQIFASKGEARKMILGGGVSINNQKISSPDEQKPKPVRGSYFLIQKGKKNHFLINVQ